MKRAATYLSGLLACLLTGEIVARADDYGTNVVENRKRIALAMADQLIGAGGEDEARVAEFGDVNLDGFWELVVRHEECATCPPAILVLKGREYVDLFAAAGAEVGGVALKLLDETTKGYRDIRARGRLFAWNGSEYADATGRGRLLDTDGFIEACIGKGEYSYYADDTTDESTATDTMCRCVAGRVGELGFAQSDLDAFQRTLELRAREEDADHIDLGLLGDEISLIGSGCAVRNGYATGLPTGPQRYATWTTNYGNLVMNPDFEGDPMRPENVLDFGGFIRACASNPDVQASGRISAPDRAVGVCGCTAEVLGMAGAEQGHVDALAGLYDYSLSEDEANAIAEGLVEFSDEASNWCANRLSALVDGEWPEAPK